MLYYLQVCHYFDKPEFLAYLPLLQNLFMKFATTVRSLHFFMTSI
ncbi:hypothetical protein AO385_2196 [Moraxella catarrhalis]|uniref:Uncharacterized protein n=1 Tax=Moraxella catarrhalis TaxID=480 RepID=A0A198UCL7_MORCA|nr:hypothetical protein AO385_2196 [Moraxella catarrhalis]OAU94183.1 hypothetical protein AO384_2229 [Moraxella catarrhalis]OAU99680.1 hypothetical protein AO383_0137 [Moraxella catarrhalis]